jgi:cbb3-type cytochrome oxidase subunit 3
MRIITHSLDQVSGLDILASGSLVVFFILFLWIVYRIIRTSKNDSKEWAKMPLELEEQATDIRINEPSNG